MISLHILTQHTYTIYGFKCYAPSVPSKVSLAFLSIMRIIKVLAPSTDRQYMQGIQLEKEKEEEEEEERCSYKASNQPSPS
ncbi:unnamed protein product [Periconia digitata]|uniref:Uncharacterized protein n=1 Tax=Periconia digitata TaxID=1303443 RepID=A0A9W4UTL2_9PLEO|nr:unnamed protein product [Periconia digitata]